MCMSLGLCLNNDQSIAFVVVIFQISNGNFHYYNYENYFEIKGFNHELCESSDSKSKCKHLW